MAELSPTQLTPLLDLVEDPSADIRGSALRALVHLPLDHTAWRTLGPKVLKLLDEMDASDAASAPAETVDPTVLVACAARVPLRTVRAKVRKLTEAEDLETRRVAALALARVRDSAGVTQLILDLKTKNEDARREAVSAIIDLPPADVRALGFGARRSLGRASKREPLAVDRFYASLALARTGRAGPLVRFLARMRRERAGFDGPPPDFTFLRALEPLPGRVRRQLEPFVAEDSPNDFPREIAERLLESPPEPGPPAARVEPVESVPADSEAVEKARRVAEIYLADETGADQVLLSPEDLDLLRSMPPGVAREVVARMYLDIAEGKRPDPFEASVEVTDLVQNLRFGIQPDLAKYFKIYKKVRTVNPSIAGHVAWTLSRAKPATILADMRSVLSGASADDRAVLADLVEDAAVYSHVADPPEMGSGGLDRGMARETEFLDHETPAGPGGTRGSGGGPVNDGEEAGDPADDSVPPPSVEHRANGGSRSAEDEEGLFLNATVDELPADGEPVRRFDGFARGGRHRVEVNLATEERATGIVADARMELDREVEHRLTISFQAAWLSDVPPPRELVVKTDDEETEAAALEFDLPAELVRVEILVIVHETTREGRKVIQTALLAGDVVEPGEQGAGITFTVDPGDSRPAERGSFDVSLVLADDTLAVYASDEALGLEPPGSLREFRKKLGDKVLELWSTMESDREVARARPDGGQGLDDELARALLNLAARGRDMKELLETHLRVTAGQRDRLFRGTGAIQLVSRDLRTDLPIEFVHDGPKPDRRSPSLCDGFFAALEEGACRDCPNRGNAICAFDFWGLKRRIERRVVWPKDSTAETPLRGRARVSILPAATAPALFGASATVTEASRSETISILRRLGAEIEMPVADWNAWETALEKQAYRLLVLLAHSEQEDDPGLEIDNDTLDRAWLGPEHVNPSRAEPGPLAFLTGCETARPEIDFLSFVAKFLKEGAAVVVGTLALIREDVSAEVTNQLLLALREVLDDVASLDDRSVGEVMRRVRCRLLAKHNLTGFNLVSYGDADWRFGKEPPV